MKTILLTVSGMSPAIITETIWALSRETPAVIPDEVVVITTVPGWQSIKSNLLAPHDVWGNRSVWESLRYSIFSRYGLPANSPQLQISRQLIQLSDPVGGVKRDADDTRTAADNADAADYILQILSPFVDSADQRVIASIAGGRKTMGALLYACMSLIGRESDRVTHVLVNDPYDLCPGFYYPDQPVQALEAGRPLKSVRADEAKIELADVPFVPLRNGFADLGEPRRSFAGLVQRYSREFSKRAEPPVVSFDVDKRILSINGKPIRLPKGRVTVATRFLWERAQHRKERFADLHAAYENFEPWINQLRSCELRFISIHNPPAEKDLSSGYLSKALSELRALLRKRGSGEWVPSLAPDREQVGFEVTLPETE